MLTTEQFAKKFDLALLAPDAQQATIKEACETAIKYQVASVNVNSYWAEYAASILKGSGVAICTVVGFPLGSTTATVKAIEARDAMANGADEIDMVAWRPNAGGQGVRRRPQRCHWIPLRRVHLRGEVPGARANGRARVHRL